VTTIAAARTKRAFFIAGGCAFKMLAEISLNWLKLQVEPTQIARSNHPFTFCKLFRGIVFG
jgi:hypothetical protein